MDTTRHEARIRELDRELAPGSETSLLGAALDGIRHSGNPDADLASWVGAYRMYAWALTHPERWDRHVGLGVWESADEMILESGDDWTGWDPPADNGDDDLFPPDVSRAARILWALAYFAWLASLFHIITETAQ